MVVVVARVAVSFIYKQENEEEEAAGEREEQNIQYLPSINEGYGLVESVFRMSSKTKG